MNQTSLDFCGKTSSKSPIGGKFKDLMPHLSLNRSAVNAFRDSSNNNT